MRGQPRILSTPGRSEKYCTSHPAECWRCQGRQCRSKAGREQLARYSLARGSLTMSSQPTVAGGQRHSTCVLYQWAHSPQPATQYMRTESINLYCIIILSALDDYKIYAQLALKFERRPDYKKKKASLGSMPRTKDPPAWQGPKIPDQRQPKRNSDNGRLHCS